MTTEDRIEHVTAALAEERRKDREDTDSSGAIPNAKSPNLP